MPGSLDDLRIAVVHEWLAARTGSEFVFEQLAATFPTADLYALSVEPSVNFETQNRWIRTTVFQQHKLLRDRRELTLPLMPLAWKMIDHAGPYDLVITSAHAFAREFPIGSAAHLSYVHAPMRYAWTPELDPRTTSEGPLLRTARRMLRYADLRSVASVDQMVANSTEVADRIERFYGRRAAVVHPPVQIEDLIHGEPRREGYALALSRWVTYKRLDLAIEACAIAGVPLVVAGSGPEEGRLRAVAQRMGGEVTFVHQPTRERVADLFAGASAFVFPPHEDFGIVAVEAQAAGVPVVALGAGGALDVVQDGLTGVLATSQDPDDFAAAVEKCLAMDLSPDACRRNAMRFTTERFRSSIRGLAASTVEQRLLNDQTASTDRRARATR